MNLKYIFNFWPFKQSAVNRLEYAAEYRVAACEVGDKMTLLTKER